MKKFAQELILILLDILILAASGALAIAVRFNFVFPGEAMFYYGRFGWVLLIVVIVTLAIYIPAGMYRFIWRLVTAMDLLKMALWNIVAFTAGIAISLFIFRIRLPLSVYALWAFMEFILMLAMRSSLRLATAFHRRYWYQKSEEQHRIMIIGAGSGGEAIIRDLSKDRHYPGKVCCFIDDNPNKIGKVLSGVRIVGGRDKIIEAAERYKIDEIIFAIASATPQEKKEILAICQKTKCHTKVVPGIYQLVNGEVDVAQIRDVDIADLLGRSQVELNKANLRQFIKNKRVLITGGGGSIGSELSRQVAAYEPEQLVILDIYENNAYDIQQELIRKYGDALNLKVVIASVRDTEKIEEIFEAYKPQIVFHAAAHKHVPLMEDNPSEAVKNNIFGTANVVKAAIANEAEKFVLISTDKAVNPTNFMGATKRFCEMILDATPTENCKTVFCAVRFGNVLGSNGSVIPLFKQQIAEGGPVTVTDQRITRFFMTIREAVQLVITCGSMAEEKQVFVLDMGEPVKIVDLAENLIRLSGFEPGVDITIKEIGLRPGEKLYEEVLMKTEDLQKTADEKIFIGQQEELDWHVVDGNIKKLEEAIHRGDSAAELIALLKTMVPTYKSPDEINDKVS